MRTRIIQEFAETGGQNAIAGSSRTAHEPLGGYEAFGLQLEEPTAEGQASTAIFDTGTDYHMVYSNIESVLS